jgi:hypothetical protein
MSPSKIFSDSYSVDMCGATPGQPDFFRQRWTLSFADYFRFLQID